jgi:hypothetical protein
LVISNSQFGGNDGVLNDNNIEKPRFAFLQKPLPDVGGRIFNELILRSFMRSMAAHKDAMIDRMNRHHMVTR